MIAAVGALALAATPAAAVQFVGGYTVNHFNNNNGGLNIGVSEDDGSLNFNLTSVFPFDYEVVHLFDIWADEAINVPGQPGDNDTVAKSFKINFNFTSPVTSNNVSGWTDGHWGLFGNYGTVTFDNLGLQTFNFGTTGVLNVLVFADNLGTFGRGEANGTGVYAKFALTSMPTVSAVPEPATWAMMIAGFGLAGAALRRRRSMAAIAA